MRTFKGFNTGMTASLEADYCYDLILWMWMAYWKFCGWDLLLGIVALYWLTPLLPHFGFWQSSAIWSRLKLFIGASFAPAPSHQFVCDCQRIDSTSSMKTRDHSCGKWYYLIGLHTCLLGRSLCMRSRFGHISNVYYSIIIVLVFKRCSVWVSWWDERDYDHDGFIAMCD